MNVSEIVYVSILSQQWKNEWHSIVYFSRKFSDSELNYSVYNKKLMTIVMSFKQWRHYLEDVLEIEVWSDHANFKQFMSQMMLNSCQACWLIQLTSYDFTIQYSQDTLNPVNESSWCERNSCVDHSCWLESLDIQLQFWRNHTFWD